MDFLLFYFSVFGLPEVMCLAQNICHDYSVAIMGLNALLSVETARLSLLIFVGSIVCRKFWVALQLPITLVILLLLCFLSIADGCVDNL